MKKTVYFMLFIICFMSCSNGLDRNEFIIAGNNCQYWYKASPDSFGKTRYYIYFDRKGKRVILEERYCDKKCYIYDCGDVYYEPKWKLKNDTIIIWGIKERKLTIISDSVIVTEDDIGDVTRIDANEFKELQDHFREIETKFQNYLRFYVNSIKTQTNLDAPEIKYSSLQYFMDTLVEMDLEK